MRARLALGALLAGALLLSAPARPAAAKDAPPPPAPKTGRFKAPGSPPFDYVYMAVPKDYDPAKFYPLAFVLHPMTAFADQTKPEPYVDLWADQLLAKGWIIVSPKASQYENEDSIAPLQDVLRQVKTAYHVDEHRVVLVGHNAGACMAWRLATRAPNLWAGVVALSGEITQSDRQALKGLSGKPAYLFRGTKDAYYTSDRMDEDRKALEAARIAATVEVKDGWGAEVPVESLKTISEWIAGVWPPGAYREKAAALEKALAAKDVAGSAAALAGLQAELKKSPYPAFDARAKALAKDLEALVRGLLAEPAKLLDADPAGAMAAAEALAKSLKGIKPWEAEAQKVVAALKKDPKVVEAVKQKEAEKLGASYLEKAAAAEAKGDLAKALDWAKKAAALAWSRQVEAQTKVSDLEAKGAGK